jgi:hypothetical protein
LENVKDTKMYRLAVEKKKAARNVAIQMQTGIYCRQTAK